MASSSFTPAAAADYPALADLTEEQLQRLYVKNKAELTKHVSEAVGARAQYFGGGDWFVEWYDGAGGSGPAATADAAEAHNGLEHQDVPENQVRAAVDAVARHFEGRRVGWVTGPWDQARLEHFLRRAGFMVEDEGMVMAAPLSGGGGGGIIGAESGVNPTGGPGDFSSLIRGPSLRDVKLPYGVTVVDVADASGVRGWVAAWAYKAQESGIAHWTRIYAVLVRSLHRNHFRMFMAVKGDGTPVGTGYLHCYAGVAAIHAIFVQPPFRRRGIATALTRYAMRAAADMGYATATLTAPLGRAILFSALGFRDCGRVRLNVWHPERINAERERRRAADAEDEEWCII
ncbi:hypothetical protein BX600DRAFT_443624 [Xylariales sp. PMI_506]|nr:hypothetical protein BX600DRAFT_443624 [Xylariales sp. PMI_506]